MFRYNTFHSAQKIQFTRTSNINEMVAEIQSQLCARITALNAGFIIFFFQQLFLYSYMKYGKDIDNYNNNGDYKSGNDIQIMEHRIGTLLLANG